MDNLKEIIYDGAKEIQDEIVKHRRNFHQNPEVHLDLPLTTKYVKERLVEMGYDPTGARTSQRTGCWWKKTR